MTKTKRSELDRFMRMCRGLGITSSDLRVCEEEATTFFTEEVQSKDPNFFVKVSSRHGGDQTEFQLFLLTGEKLCCSTVATERYRILTSIRHKIWDYDQAEYEKIEVME